MSTLRAYFIVCAFLVSAVLTGPAGAEAQTCSALFQTPTAVQASLLTTPLDRYQIYQVAKTAYSKANLISKFDWISAWQNPAYAFARDLSNPYSLAFDLRTESAKHGVSIEDTVSGLFSALAKRSADDRSSALNAWVSSDSHALALYDLLSDRGIEHYSEELTYLLNHNRFFAGATPTRGPPTLVTYSFEKEGSKGTITELYRPVQMNEDVWFQKSEAERLRILQSGNLPIKEFLPANVIAPTELKPSFISGYSVETEEEGRTGYSWEISHKKYEINLSRLLSQVSQVAQLFGETHSFHLHTVFETKNDREKAPLFRAWFKQLNDTMYLRGMEEGLHGNNLTAIVEFPEDVPTWSDQAFEFTHLGDLTHTQTKFYSVGLRGGEMYGPASQRGSVKIGLELRDTTRNLRKLADAMKNLSESVVSTAWEKRGLTTLKIRTPRLTADHDTSSELLESVGLGKGMANDLARAEKSVAIPLMRLEDDAIFNYRAGKFESSTAEYRERMQAARERYVKSLIAIQQEIRDYRARGETLDPVEIGLALKMSLSDWAKQARPSERFTF